MALVERPVSLPRISPLPLPLLTLFLVGVCVTTAACSAKGGTTVNNACPRDPDNVKCCTKPDCGAGDRNCRWTSDCAGSTFANQCPGPSGFKCCSSNARGWGGYSAPRIPTTGDGCKTVAINGARKIVAQFPGRVRDIGCKRSCSAGSTSDHCDGKATDMMCSDKTEVSVKMQYNGTPSNSIFSRLHLSLAVKLLSG